jgi:antitoxin MazE
MKVKIRKVGDEHGVVIPKRMLLALGLKSGDKVNIAANDGKLFVSRSRRSPRAGWAAASRRLARAHDGGLVWPEFANDGDKD